MDAGDRTALIAIYQGTGGDAWFKTTGWCTDAPFSQWHGVSVNEEGRVVRLDLRRNNLVGEVPSELGSLHNLKELDISNNKLTGEIPRELGSLHNLENLDLSGNNLIGEIPRELSSLHNLKGLHLNHNELTGEIPRELGSLHNLKALYLNHNELTGEIPRELGSLHNLDNLDLSGNNLIGEIPRELGSLHNLKGLYLNHNELTGEIPRELGSLHNFDNLDLSGNNLIGEIPRELGSLHNLKGLYLNHNELTGEIPRELGSLHNLENLDLSGNNLIGELPRELGSLHNLKGLYLSNNKLTGTVPAQLVKLHSQWRLDLDDNNFSGPLPSLRQLKDLFDALARAGSGHEEPPMYSDTTLLSEKGPVQQAASPARTVVTTWTTASSLSEPPMYFSTSSLSEKGPIQQAASSASKAVTTSMAVPSLSGPSAYSGTPHLEWEEYQEITEAEGREKLRKVIARVSDLEGDVMAWSFGSTSEVFSCPDFELEVPDLGREVPALIGQSPSEAEMADGDVCLFHPVVTCLAGSGEIFNPPLLLRFSVGDAVESGSDVGSSNEDEESYKAGLRSRYSAVKREEGSPTWVPIVGEVKKMDNGVFVLEAQVSHFTDYALKQGPLSLPWSVSIGQGGVEKITDKKLRNVSLFENKGDETIMLYYWRRRTRRSWIPRARVSVGVAPVEVSGEVDREILDCPTAMVYDKLVISNQYVALNNTKSLEVAWATLEARDDHRLVTVWGWDTMDPREAMRIGPLRERVYARVTGLRIADGEDVGTRVRASLGS